MSALEYEGIWKIPGYKDLELYGKLVIDDTIKLNIKGALPLSLENESINIIHGYTDNGKLITLVDSININSSINFHGTFRYTYKSKFVFIGKLFNNLDELNIYSISSRYTYLEEWINIYGFNAEFNKSENFEINLKYKLPNSIKYKLQSFDLDINFRAKTKGDLRDCFTINQSAFVTFSNIKNNLFDICIDNIIELSKFMTLCIGKNVKFYDVKIKDNRGNIIEFYTSSYKNNKEVEVKKLMEHEIFIPYKYIEGELGQCILQWYDIKDKLKPIINYFIDICDINYYEPITFIKAIQALETFSRRILVNCKDDENVHNKRVEYIISSINNQEYREWLEKRLEFSNEPSLSNRIAYILKETKFILNINEKRRKSLIKKLVDTRNYYTHFDESKKDKIMNGEEIIWSTNYIIILLKVLVMNELGIDREIIKRRISEGYRESQIINRFSEVFKINS